MVLIEILCKHCRSACCTVQFAQSKLILLRYTDPCLAKIVSIL